MSDASDPSPSSRRSRDPSCLASVPGDALAPGASVLLPVKVWRGTKPTGSYTTALQVTTSLAFQPSLQFTVKVSRAMSAAGERLVTTY